MNQRYNYSVLYFLLFSLLLVTSGVMLFEQKIGFSVENISEYYLGSVENFTAKKTPAGILKIVLPHLFAFGLFTMVILHFLIFTKHRNKRGTKFLIYTMFISAFFEISSPFFIILGIEVFVYIKLLSFVLFELLILYTSWLLFKSIMQK